MSVKEVLPGIFMIKVPLPGSPLKSLNSYVIMAKRPLIIDTGFNMDECYVELVKALNEIGVDYRRADYFITHLHADHLGLAGRLTSTVYISEGDAIIMQEPSSAQRILRYLSFFTMNGFPLEDLDKVLRSHPAVRYYSEVNFQVVKDGELFEYGDYKLKAILTPGHTPGHMCLYDEDNGVLFSGDHILFDITPNVPYWEGHDSLWEYLNSLDKIYSLDVKHVLPGHREFHGDVKKRILELKEHHERRLDEVVNALKSGAKTAWQVAPEISWDLTYDQWDAINPIQKWFIISETIAHLIYLENRGIVKEEIRDDRIYYMLAK